MTTYCTDEDLKVYRSEIMEMGVTSWEDQRNLAYAAINRLVISRWYNRNAPDQGIDPYVTPFDPELVKEGEFRQLECFKTLELAYMILMKDDPEPDGFERNMGLFARQYGNEFDSLISSGIDYDWDSSGVIETDEKQIRAPRRILRA